MEQKLHPGKAALKLPNPGYRPNGVEDFRVHILDVLPLGYGKYQAVGTRQRGFDAAQRSRPSGTNRRSDTRKENDFPQGKDRKRQSFGHSCTPKQCLTSEAK
jgi:hypothetical protein